MTKKSELVQKLLKKITPRAPLPKPLKDRNLLEQGMMVALVRHMPQSEAENVLEKLRKAYPDWNELRVAQAHEIAGLIVTGERRAPRNEVAHLFPAARAAREYLQEIFQKVHGFDLEFMREDPVAAAKAFAQMPYLGIAGTCYLMWLAAGKQLPVHPALVRVIERLGLAPRVGGLKKARDVIVPLVPPGDELEFVSVFGEVADRWCGPQKPICQECPLVDDCAFGKKAFQEWKVQQARLEVQRQREEARRAILERKEAARRAREDARNAKKAALEAAKAARERERLAKIEARRKEAEAKAKAKIDLAAKRAQQEAQRKAALEARKKEAAAKKAQAEAKKVEAARKAAKAKALAKQKALAKKSARPKKKPKPSKKGR